MQKRAKIATGSAAALAILVAGGLAIALPAQAAPTSSPQSVVEQENSATDTDSVQNEVEDGTADSAGAAEESGSENTSDDVNGVAVEDGHQD